MKNLGWKKPENKSIYEKLKHLVNLLKEIKLLRDVDLAIEAFIAFFRARPESMCQKFITGFVETYLNEGDNGINRLAKTWIDAFNPVAGGQQGYVVITPVLPNLSEHVVPLELYICIIIIVIIIYSFFFFFFFFSIEKSNNTIKDQITERSYVKVIEFLGAQETREYLNNQIGPVPRHSLDVREDLGPYHPHIKVTQNTFSSPPHAHTHTLYHTHTHSLSVSFIHTFKHKPTVYTAYIYANFFVTCMLALSTVS